MSPAEAQALAKRAASTGLLRVEEAREILSQCRRVDEAKSIRDQAEAIKAYLRQQSASREAQNDAAEIKLRAERRLGELLTEKKESGERADAKANLRRGPKLQPATSEDPPPPTLADLGIEKTAAKRWQDVAKVPEERFEQYIQAQRLAPTGEITTAGLGRLAADRNRSAALGDDNEDERFTPRELIEVLHRAYRFTVDAAGHPASPATALIQRAWYQKDDGLFHSWTKDRVWCNPPFSACEEWVAKADRAVRIEICPLVVMLLPAVRTEQPWWQRYIESYRDRPAYGGVTVSARFLPGRTRYGNPLDPEGEKSGSPRFGSVLVAWTRGAGPDLRTLDLEPLFVEQEPSVAALSEFRRDAKKAGFRLWKAGGLELARCFCGHEIHFELTKHGDVLLELLREVREHEHTPKRGAPTCRTRGCNTPIMQPYGGKYCAKCEDYEICREPGCKRATTGYSTKDGAWCSKHRPEGHASEPVAMTTCLKRGCLTPIPVGDSRYCVKHHVEKAGAIAKAMSRRKKPTTKKKGAKTK